MKRVRIGALAALAAVLAVKFAVLIQLGHHPLLVPEGGVDDAYYVHFAERVATGDVWLASPDSFFGHAAPAFPVPPLYVYFLALCLKVGRGSLEVAKVVQIVLGTIGVGLIGLTARRWYGARAGWIAGGLATLCGLFSFYELLLGPAALDPCLTALDLWLLTRALQEGGTRRWTLAGLAFGLHALNRPSVLLVVCVIAAIQIVRALMSMRGSTWKLTPAAIAAFVLAPIVVIAPATIRNWHVAHEFVPLTWTSGLDLLTGNGPDADGTLTAAMGVAPTIEGRWAGAMAAASNAVGHQTSAGETSRFFRAQSFAWMRAHPGAEFGLIVRKTWYALSATFITVDHSYPFFARDEFGPLTFLSLGPALLLPLAIVAFVFARPRIDDAGAWLGIACAWLVPLVVFYVTAPGRVPLQMALVVAAGGGLAYVLDRLAVSEWSAVGGAALVAIPAVALSAWPTHLDDGRAEERVRRGLSFIQAGQIDEGETWIARAQALGENPEELQMRVGQVYEMMSRPNDAVGHYRQALQYDPGNIAAHFALGRALFGAKDYVGAIGELDQARRAPDVEDRDAATRLYVLTLAHLGRMAEVNQAIHALDPSRWSADVSREFALALMDAGRLDLSIAAWQHAAAAGQSAKDYERLGLAWAVYRENAQALAAFDTAERLDPSSASIKLNRGVALAAAGRIPEARAEAAAALKLAPNDARIKKFLDALGK